MKHGIYTALAISLCFVAQSCSEDTEGAMVGGVSNALVKTTDFTPADDFCDLQTRSSLDPTASSITFSWAEGDKLAVYSVNGTGMTNFDLDLSRMSDDPSVAIFKANGFNLKKTEDYLAFSPYNGNNTDKTEVAVNYDGILQEGNGTYSHLGAYDYQWAKWAKATAQGNTDAANITFTFAHAGAICRFRINGLPQGPKFSRMTISCDGIITKGTIDLTQTTPTIGAASDNSTTQSIKLGESGFGADANGTLTVYTMMAPANLSGKNMTISLYSGDMKMVSFSVNGKNMAAGEAYGYSATYTAPSSPSLPEGLGYVDLGLRLNDEPVLFANQNFSTNGATTFQWTEEDPVTAAWGLNWRTPTSEELELLFINKSDDEYPLTWEPYMTDGKCEGVTVKNTKDDNKYIVLPTDYQNNISRGYYWSSTMDSETSAKYCSVEINDYGTTNSTFQDYKEKPYMIRPVYIGNQQK